MRTAGKRSLLLYRKLPKALLKKKHGKRTERTFKIFGFKFSSKFFTVGLFRYEDKHTAS